MDDQKVKVSLHKLKLIALKLNTLDEAIDQIIEMIQGIEDVEEANQ